MSDPISAILRHLPVDLPQLQTQLSGCRYTPDMLHDAAMSFIDLCLSQDAALNSDDAPAETLYCAALPQVLALLLDHGMDPNRVVWREGQSMVSSGGEDCLLRALRPIEWGNVAAQCVRLLLERGADPRLTLKHIGDPFGELYGIIDEAICEYGGCPDSYVHQLAVMLGYGAAAVTLADGASPESLRRFEELEWHAAFTEPEDEYASPDTILHFTDRATGREIASY